MDQQKHIEALETLVGQLWLRVDEATVVSEAVLHMLKKHGVLAPGEIEATLADGRRTLRLGMLKAMKEGLDAYQEDVLRRVLERVRGPKH